MSPRRRTRGSVVALGVAALATAGLTSCSAGDESSSAGADQHVLLSMDLAMGLTSGNANGTLATPSDYDDDWALALITDQRDVDIAGVVVTMGNGPLGPEMSVAQQTLDRLDVDVPLIAGAATWLPVVATLDSSGADLSATCVNDGVEFMANELRETEDLTIIATGPLTDVACLALVFPDEAANIAEIIALIGSAPDGLTYAGKPVRDFNYSMDPRALSVIVNETTIPFIAVTFEASSSTAVSTDVVGTLAADASPTAQYFGRASQAYAAWWASIFGPTKPVWDASAIWRFLHPEDFDCEPARFELKLGAPNQPTEDTHDWVVPDPTSDGRVEACMSYTDPSAIDRMNAAVLAAIRR